MSKNPALFGIGLKQKLLQFYVSIYLEFFF